MRIHLVKCVILIAALMFPAIVIKAQSADTSLFISLSPTTVTAGEWSGVSGIVINNTSAKVRLTVTFSAVDPCGTKTDLGYNRLALNPGQSVLITTAYPTKATSCRGTHVVTISTGGKSGAPAISASANLEVQ